MQRQTIVAADGSGLIGEAGTMERVKEKIAGAIASECAAGAVPAVRGGRKANDEQLGVCVPKARYWLAPIVPAKKGAALNTGDGFAIEDQTRAFAAGRNRVVEDFQRVYGAR